VHEIRGSPGQIIADRYELRELIGQGGMGCVWRARHRTLRNSVAVKLLTPGTGDEEALLGRFAREAQAAASLRGPNVVHILDHGVDAGVAYIAMELLEGETLGARLRSVKKLTPAEATPVLVGVVRAIARAHRVGIVHRDLKPENIFLARDEEGGPEIVKVLDFGIAKLVRHDPLAAGTSMNFGVTERPATHSGMTLGTPSYMSPEQARALPDLDGRTDLWSFAVIAFECLTGRRPFNAEVFGLLVLQICVDPMPRPSDFGAVPEGFDAWFERATQRERDRRFQNVHDLARELAAVLTPGRAWLDAGADVDTGSKPLPTSSAADRAEVPVEARAAPMTSTTEGHVTSESQRASAGESRAGVRRGRMVVGALGAVLAVGVLGVALTRRPGSTAPGESARTAAAPAPPAPSAVVSASSTLWEASAGPTEGRERTQTPASAAGPTEGRERTQTPTSPEPVPPTPSAVTSTAATSSASTRPGPRPAAGPQPVPRHPTQSPAAFGSTNLGI
jgi:serine/threonine-protein kinase